MSFFLHSTTLSEDLSVSFAVWNLSYFINILAKPMSQWQSTPVLLGFLIVLQRLHIGGISGLKEGQGILVI